METPELERLSVRPHDKFDALPPQRKQAVIEAALDAFGARGYAHASTADIAQCACISKGLLFYYFKNKRELYLYLMDWLTESLSQLVVDDEYLRIDDFFELMHYTASKKTEVFRQHPRALDFCVRAFYPRHRDVRHTLDGFMQQATDQIVDRYLANVRWDKFRDDMPGRHVIDMLIWMSDGYMHQQLRDRGHVDLDALLEEFDGWCKLLRHTSYKEEYL